MNVSFAHSIRSRIAALPETARAVIIGAAAFVLGEVGTRISAPHINGRVLGELLQRTSPGGLLGLYDRLVGGALSRGAVLALGIMPYLSARIFMRIAREVSPAVGALHRDAAGRKQLTRATRWLTLGLSLVQSYGFAKFALSVPGAVTNPGAGFIAETMLVLTTGAVIVMTLSEQFAGIVTDHDGQQPTTIDDNAVTDTVPDDALDANAPLRSLPPATPSSPHRRGLETESSIQPANERRHRFE